MIKTISNYLSGWTETFRGNLAWKIFPEFGFYVEAIKRVGAIEENERCLVALEEADSACAGWAQETIAIKYVTYEEILDKLKEEGFKESPL